MSTFISDAIMLDLIKKNVNYKNMYKLRFLFFLKDSQAVLLCIM